MGASASEKIEKILYSDAVRRTPDMPQKFSVIDAIAHLTGHDAKRAWTDFERVKSTNGDTVTPRISTYKFPGQGQRPTPVTDYTTTWHIVKLVLCMSRISLEAKRKILGITDYYPVRKYTEIEIHTNVRRALAHVDIHFQYPVKEYRIDMYFPKYNIAVECNENGHRAYCKENENTRHDVISKYLQCQWVQYDPYASDFNIFDLINRLYREIERERI